MHISIYAIFQTDEFYERMSKQFGKTLILNVVRRPDDCPIVQPMIRESRDDYGSLRKFLRPPTSYLAILFRRELK